MVRRTTNFFERTKSDNSTSNMFLRNNMPTGFSQSSMIEAYPDRHPVTTHMFRHQCPNVKSVRPWSPSMSNPKFRLHTVMFRALLSRLTTANSNHFTLHLTAQQLNSISPLHSTRIRKCHHCLPKSLRSHKCHRTIAHTQMLVVCLWYHLYRLRLQMYQAQHHLHNERKSRV